MKIFILENTVTSKLFYIEAKSLFKALETLYFKHGVATHNMRYVGTKAVA